MKNPCNIVRDLLPLYVDGVCSPDSRELVEEHLAVCPACRELLERMGRPQPPLPGPGPEMKRLRRHILALVLLAALLAFSFAANLAGAWMGGPAGWGHLAVTLLFAAGFTAFVRFTAPYRPCVRAALIVSGYLTAAGLLGFLLVTFRRGGFLSGLLLGPASVPFYGLRLFLDWPWVWLCTALISGAWLALSIYNRKRLP